MKLSTQTTLFALLALTTLVLCQSDVTQDVVSEEETEVKNEVINAADIVSKAFSPDKDNETEAQLSKRGFFDKLWDDVKDTVIGTAVKNALDSVGKRDVKTWKKGFSSDKDNQTEPQLSKRGFFDKLWDDVKDTVIGTAVKNALDSVGKRDVKTWKKGFSSDKDNQTEPQLSKRGFFSKLRSVVAGTAVKNALQGLGKRDSKPWTDWWRNRTELYEKSRDAKDAGTPSGFCDPEYLNQIETLEQALEVLGTVTSLVQSLKKCV